MPGDRLLSELGYKLGELSGKAVTRKSSWPSPRNIGRTHPDIVHVYEFIEVCNGQLYIIMEVAETDLLQRVQKMNHIPGPQAKQMLILIVSAVSYLQDSNIVHRERTSH
ncbi:TSSK6 kinase, partial [Polyodon spathula]|nr:TSSK6 kinase [Polyodon spathula]